VQKLSAPHPRNLGLKKYLPAALLGFVASGFQIYLIREFSAYFYGNEMTYGLVLGSWLLWGGLGSFFASRRKIAPTRFYPVIYSVIILFPVCLAALRLLRFPLHLLPGEVTGLSLMLPFAMAITFLVNFPLGMLFVLAVRGEAENVSRVYIGESLGAALGGLSVSLVIIPVLSNWRGAAMVGAVVAAAALALPEARRRLLASAVLLVILSAFWLCDLPSQRLYWKPFTLLASRDTPYGKLQVIKAGDQVSLYSDGLPVYSSGDTAAAEESIHFAFLQAQKPRRALLMGGAAGGLAEALKYPGVKVDDVELDPEIVRLSLVHLPEKDRAGLKDPRVRIYYQDGRTFLRSARDAYDLILLNLPEPANARINRFYTREFFALARKKLTADGVFSFRVPSSESYISPGRLRFLATLFRSLKPVFREVKVVPGETNIFLASDRVLTLDPETLSSAVERLGLANVFVRRELLATRLSGLRVLLLKDMLSGPASASAATNSDLAPVSYFYDSILWNAQFRSLEARLLTGLADVPRGWLLGLPLAAALAFLALMALPGKRAAFDLVPLFLLGFTTIVAEVLMLLWFQTIYGSVYSRLALLLGAFMAGLFLGALLSRRLRGARPGRPVLIQSGLIAWLVLLFLLLKVRLPEPLFYMFLLVLGFLAGDMFVTANRLYLVEKRGFGLGYGLDLLGSFFGALAASSILIPLLGLPAIAAFLTALNVLGLIFLAFGWKKTHPTLGG
jgi:spermidine synthase